MNGALVAALFAVDPVGTGGVCVRGHPGPAREAWLAHLRELLPATTPLRKLPLHVSDERLLGGLDLAATLRLGRPVAQTGLLVECDGGVLLLVMAERMAAGTAAKLTAVLDTRQVQLQRDGLSRCQAARLGVVALDEGVGADESVSAALRDRLAFELDVDDEPGDASAEAWQATREQIAAARARLPQVRYGDDIVQALCAATLALGVASARAPLLALCVARCAAALHGRDTVSEDDAALAASCVLAPRATQLPADEAAPGEPTQEKPAEPPQAQGEAGEEGADKSERADRADDPPAAQTPAAIEDVVLEAARAAIPAGLLAAMRLGAMRPSRGAAAGKSGAANASRLRGRPNGVRRGEPRAGGRLNLIETLRAAAPWQALRRAQAGPSPSARIQVRLEDFHITRFKQRSQTTTVFVVDASGSSALHRLAEAKGAVELLLADCYVRRDSVAVLAFRGSGAELLLPPTRSLVRARRSLAGLPGGGGTPLAHGIDAAVALAEAVRRRGDTPLVVLLTDGRANIARDGSPGRPRAHEDALSAARQLRAAGFSALLLDTSAQPQAQAEQLALAMGAAYLPLPHAGAAVLSQAVRGAAAVLRP